MTLWPYSDYFRKHRIFADLKAQRHGMVFFTNLHTCFNGSHISGRFTIEPPTVAEHLYSCNNQLMYNQQRAWMHGNGNASSWQWKGGSEKVGVNFYVRYPKNKGCETSLPGISRPPSFIWRPPSFIWRLPSFILQPK